MSEQLLALRSRVDAVDAEIIKLLGTRFAITREIGQLKARQALDAVDASREAAQAQRYAALATESGLEPDCVRTIFRVIIDEVVSQHRLIARETPRA